MKKTIEKKFVEKCPFFQLGCEYVTDKRICKGGDYLDCLTYKFYCNSTKKLYAPIEQIHKSKQH